MFKQINLLLITALTITAACTATPEMIEAQKSRCTQVGYTPGTLEHAQCAERGTTQQQEMQNAAAGAVGAVGVGTILGAIVY